MNKGRLLIVEDDSDILEMLRFNLERAGFYVEGVESAEDALIYLNGPLPDALIIDWMLPGISGTELIRRLRQDELTASLPLLMLTARGEEADKLRSFDVGVDDYLSKPFSPRELMARLKALLRRSHASAGETIEIENIQLDAISHQFSVGGQPIHLGPTEYRLLEFFLRHPGRAYSRNQLLDQVWGRGVYLEERTVDVHILRLRKLLKKHGKSNLIQTVRGVGYRFSPPDR